MSDWLEVFSEVVRVVQPDLDPVLSKGDGNEPDGEKELDQILLKSMRGVTWQASTSYSYGQTVFPTSRNGHKYRVIQVGTSGASEPSWSTGIESQTVSGGAVFEEDGGDYSSVYDVRKACYDAWNLKAAKAAPKNQVISDGRGQSNSYLYLNCVRERDKYISIGVA